MLIRNSRKLRLLDMSYNGLKAVYKMKYVDQKVTKESMKISSNKPESLIAKWKGKQLMVERIQRKKLLYLINRQIIKQMNCMEVLKK